MARVRIRTALLVLGGTVALSAIGGYGLSRANGTGDEADDSVSVAEAGIYDEPQTLPTAPQLSGDQLPEVTLVDLDGDEISTAALTGQPMVINFWFSTCAPCAKELPDFAAVFETAIWHEGLHCGQITVARRALGFPPLVDAPPK